MNKWKKEIAISLLFGALLVLGLRKYIIESEVDREGVYIIAKITETHVTNRGRVVRGWAKYKDDTLKINAKLLFDYYVAPDTRYLIKVLPSYPKHFIHITDKKVPSCFDKDEYMGHIWKEFPACDKSIIRER